METKNSIPVGKVSPIQTNMVTNTGTFLPQIEERRKEDWKSNDITEITKALCQAQMEMSAVVQSKINPFYKSNYADINDLLKSVLPVITKHGLAVTQGNRFCLKTSGFYVTTTLCHTSGQWFRSEVRIPMTGKKDAQAVGQMCTYGRRYGLGAILGISVTKDDDGNSLT